MSLFVDTSVWSLAFRRDRPAEIPEVAALMQELEGGNLVTTTGLVYQELLQGFHGPSDQQAIVERFSALPFLMPDPDWSERPRAARDLHQAVREPARSTGCHRTEPGGCHRAEPGARHPCVHIGV